VLECLALSMTSCHVGSDGWRTSVRALAAMDAAADEGDPHRWSTAHRTFHRGLLSGCGDAVTQLLAALPDHTEQASQPTAEPWATNAEEHTVLLDALARGDLADAVSLLARHLAGSGGPGIGTTVDTGLPTAVCRAVELVSRPRRGTQSTPA
jgi:DNA-binding GntR family transcriptional regulator